MEISEILKENQKLVGAQIAPIKCYLCDKNFMVGDESYLMFEKRLTETDEEDVSMATVLSSAIGKDIIESTAHSKVLCHSCNELILEFELIEQRYIELKFKLLKDYNKVVKRYETKEIVLEIPEEQIDNIEETNENEDIIEQIDDTQSSRVALTSLDKQDFFEYLLDKSFITVSTKNDNKHDLDNLNDNSKDFIKIENSLVEEIDNKYTDEPLTTTENKSDIEISPQDIHFDQIDEQSQFSTGDNTLDDEVDTTTLQFIGDDNASLKSADFSSQFELELEPKTKLITTDDTRPSFLFDGEKFFCLQCPDSDTENALESFDFKTITQHLKEVHDVILYACYFCGGGFSKKSDLIEHSESSKCCQIADYHCEICSLTFSDLRTYKSHSKFHTNSYECQICNGKFSSQNILDEHYSVHSGKRPFKCNICTKDFTSKYTLTSHMKIHSDRQRPFACNKCSKSFLTAANLQQHSRTHSNIKLYVCDICEKSFATQHNLVIHKIVHTGHKPFLCRTCGKSFARRAEITDHERTHTGEKPFECDICGIRFAQRSNLSTHKKSTHFNEKKHKCDTCEKSFKRKRLLDYHIQAAHTGERPYKCESCHSTFVYPEHYKKHLRIHSGIKPYPCEVCGKTFNSRDNRNAHRFIHSDKKPYECLTCGQGFMRKPLLYNHMQSSNHFNDTIIVNQPRIKPNTTTQESSGSENNSEIQIKQESSNNFEIVMDTRVISMEETDDIDEIVLEEEHLIESIDGQDSTNNTLVEENDENEIKQENLDDKKKFNEMHSIKKYLKQIV